MSSFGVFVGSSGVFILGAVFTVGGGAVARVVIAVMPVCVKSGLLGSSSFLLFLVTLPVGVPKAVLVVRALARCDKFAMGVGVGGITVGSGVRCLLSIGIPVVTWNANATVLDMLGVNACTIVGRGGVPGTIVDGT